MLYSYWISAWRNLAHNRLYAAINIVGLVIGLAAAILIGLYLRDEFGYDHWIPGYRQVYRVEIEQRFGSVSQPVLPVGINPAAIANWVKTDFAQVQAAARMTPGTLVLRRRGVNSRVTVYWADPELFDVLPLPALDGDPRQALESPDALVLTQRMARRYFGSDAAIGQTLELDGHTFQVVAVLRDLPSETNLAFQIFASSHSPDSALSPPGAPWRWDSPTLPVLTYVRLRPGTDAIALARALRPVILQHLSVPLDRTGKPLLPPPLISLQPLSRLHFMHGVYDGIGKPPGSLEADYVLGAVGVLIVLIAGFNFVSLATARAARRAVEVGVRKVAGASRRDLLLQFLGESLLTVAIAALIAVALVELLLPTLDAFLGRDITFAWWRDPQIAGFVAILTGGVGVLGGLYPSMVLARFAPTAVLRGGPLSPGGGSAVRKGLVVLQFAVLTGLLLTTAVVYEQTRFATHDSLRFDTDQVLVVRTDCGNAFPDEVRALPGVRAAACTDAAFGTFGGTQWIIPHGPNGSQANVVSIVAVDRGLLEVLGLSPLAGRFFSSDHPADAAQSTPGPAGIFGSGGTVVINQTAVRKLGFASPEAAIGHAMVMPGMETKPMIIGVAPDIELQGARHEIQPTLYRLLPRYHILVVKLSGRQLPETLAQIDRLWRRLGTGLPIERSFLDQDIQLQYLDVMRQAQAFAVFAAIAIFIAGLGLLGLSAFTAERRIKEIGIRKSMGASARQIVLLLLWQFSKPVLIANLLAWPVAGYLMARWLQGFFYHIALSWWLFAASGAAALLIALATVATHSILVARERPVTALRYE